MTVHVPDPEDDRLGRARADTSIEARTAQCVPRQARFPDDLLKKAVDIAKMAPTSVNQSPLRILFLRSKEAKERLRPALAPGNLEKTMTAPGRRDRGL